MKNYLHQDVGFNLFKAVINEPETPLVELFERYHTSRARAYEFFRLHFGKTPGVLRKRWHVPGHTLTTNSVSEWQYEFDYHGETDTFEPTDITRRGKPFNRAIELVIHSVEVIWPPETNSAPLSLWNMDEHVLMSNPVRRLNLNHRARLEVSVQFGISKDTVCMMLIDNYGNPLTNRYHLKVRYDVRYLNYV